MAKAKAKEKVKLVTVKVPEHQAAKIKDYIAQMNPKPPKPIKRTVRVSDADIERALSMGRLFMAAVKKARAEYDRFDYLLLDAPDDLKWVDQQQKKLAKVLLLVDDIREAAQ